MPCKVNCDQRLLLLAKENKITKVQQTIRWINDLGSQEPHRGEEILAKLNVVNTEIVNSMAEAGLLVNKRARGCRQCNNQE